ncbi:hypothetical protein WAI453_013703 [Rhynchosporium graminicola]
MPTCHAFIDEKVLTISVASGTLIRPIRTTTVDVRGRHEIKYKGVYVDSICVHESNTLKILGMSFPTKSAEPEQYFNNAVSMIICGAWTIEPRLSLGLQMLRQSISTTPIKGDTTIVSLGPSEPLIMTSFANAV